MLLRPCVRGGDRCFGPSVCVGRCVPAGLVNLPRRRGNVLQPVRPGVSSIADNRPVLSRRPSSLSHLVRAHRPRQLLAGQPLPRVLKVGVWDEERVSSGRVYYRDGKKTHEDAVWGRCVN